MILADATKTGPHELQLSSGPHGKPVLSGNSSVHFNVSRSGGTALVAVTREADVGVDIERLDAKIEASTMARHFFSVSERAELATLSAIDRARGFFNAWTRKEAYLKARGDGIAHGLDHFDVTLAPETSAALTNDRREPPAPNHWCLTNLDAPEGFVAALATRGQTLAVRRCQFDWTTASRQIDAS